MNDTELSKPLVVPFAATICLFGLLLTIYTSWTYYQNVQQQETDGYGRATQQAGQVVKVINAEMQTEMMLAHTVAHDLSSGLVPFTQAEIYAQGVFNRNTELLGLALGFAPYAFQPDLKLHAPYLLRDAEGNTKLISIPYDYTDSTLATAQWYIQGMQNPSGVWVGPYYGKASEDTIFVYALPFKAPGKDSYAGVVTIAHSVSNTFKRFTQNVDLGFGGYLFLVNADNQITYHPETKLILADVSQIAKRIDGFDLQAALRTGNNGNKLTGNIALTDDPNSDKQSAWFFIRPLSNPLGWKAVVVISTMDKTYNPRAIIRQYIGIYLALLIFGIGLGMLIIRVDKMTTTHLMIFSVWVGLLFLGGILMIWWAIYQFPELNHQKVLINETGIEANLKDMNKSFELVNLAAPRKIPTGILIENLTMTTQSVKVSGYLWQRFPADFPEENINFPQLTDQVGGLVNEEVYRYMQNNERVVGWFFSTEVQQHLDNLFYPLDQAIIKIQIEPSKLGSNYVLVPAVLDYDYMAPNVKPGLDRKLSVKGWTIRNSFFTYKIADYGTTFGLFRQVPKDAMPNLIFNVRMNRNILSPIIAYCIVIYIVVMQVYGLSILRIDNPYQVMSIAAALFLVVAITHNGMRDAVVITGVVYLEYFFILLYLTILATTINAFMNAAKVPILILTYRDNLLIKVLFWPTFLGIGLLFTLLTFYPR